VLFVGTMREFQLTIKETEMAPEANNNDKSSLAKNAVPPSEFPSCGPGCGCGEPAGKVNTKLKMFLFLVVVAAVGGILFFKTSSARQNTSAIAKNGFSNPYAAASPKAVTNSAGQQGGSGALLPSISELDAVAAEMDTVFLLIPGKDKTPISKKAGIVLASVERTLNEKGLSTGIFTLQTESPDYPGVAAKVTAPGIAVLTKGRTIGFVSGGITETNLMQAYVASKRSGGCGPKGCPPAAGGGGKPCN